MTRLHSISDHMDGQLNIFSWIFGIAVLAVGIINTFWGNDPLFGIFLILLSFVYFPPVTTFVYILFGFSVPVLVKLLLAVFIILAALGVGELFDKIELMRQSF